MIQLLVNDLLRETRHRREERDMQEPKHGVRDSGKLKPFFVSSRMSRRPTPWLHSASSVTRAYPFYSGKDMSRQVVVLAPLARASGDRLLRADRPTVSARRRHHCGCL